VEGYRAGAQAVRRAVDAALHLGIGTLTLYAFSSDNWQRPAHEVAALLRVLQDYLEAEVATFVRRGVRASVIGRRDRLPAALRAAIRTVEAATVHGRALHLRLAVDYSARDAILRAACRLYTSMQVSQAAFSRLLAGVGADGVPSPDVDLLIRTGGEQRLSDFLLWECAYAELVFTVRMWPEFAAADLEAAIQEFRSRERRFGRIPEAAAS